MESIIKLASTAYEINFNNGGKQQPTEESTTEISEIKDESIISLSWNAGLFAAAHYKLNTMELFVMQEIVDLKPDFCILNNLLRQLNAVCVLASGPRVFLQKIMIIIGLPKDVDPYDYRIGNNNISCGGRRGRGGADSAGGGNGILPPSDGIPSFFVYGINNSKMDELNRQRIMSMHLPGMPDNCTQTNRKLFLESVLPMQQSMNVNSIGNLLQYLQANWRNLFLRNDPQPIIVNVKVYRMEKQVLIDRESLIALNIFSPLEHHPSGFIKGTTNSCHEGFSLYALMMNTCSSKIGQNTLKSMMNQPICDLSEIMQRHSIINWYVNYSNKSTLIQLKNYLKNITNINMLFTKLLMQNGRPSHWHLFRNSIYSLDKICQLCLEIKQNINDADDTTAATIDIINELSNWTSIDNNVLKVVLFTIEFIVNIDEGLKRGQFTVKYGVDDQLDKLKYELVLMYNELNEQLKIIINDLPFNVPPSTTKPTYQLLHIAEYGFVIVVLKRWINQSLPTPNELSNEWLQYAFQSDDKIYYNLLNSNEHHLKYNNLKLEIHKIESLVCEKLLNYIQNYLPHLQTITNLCGKFDGILALAIFAQNYHLTKPQICENKQNDEKYLKILNGRHILCETTTDKCIPNQTDINVINKKLITILCAPNASGKSVYLKQIGLIAYLTHIGSYVPADLVKITLLDSIHIHIHTPESIYHGTSSFSMELQKLAWSISNSSTRSLILIDEFGKGTSVKEGKSILTAVIRNLMERTRASPVTILSTHFNDIFHLLSLNLSSSLSSSIPSNSSSTSRIVQAKEWISLKTFECQTNEMGQIISTYQLIDANNLCEKYAFKTHVITDILKEFNDDDNDDDDDNNRNTNNQQQRNENQLNKQLNFTMDILKRFINNGVIDTDQLLMNLNSIQ